MDEQARGAESRSREALIWDLQQKADENWKLYQETIFQLNAAKEQRDAALLQNQELRKALESICHPHPDNRRCRLCGADRSKGQTHYDDSPCRVLNDVEKREQSP